MEPGRAFFPSASEETTLPPGFIRDEEERPNVAYNHFSHDVPVISLAGIDEGLRRAEIRRDVMAACEEWGIFQVVDHGVEQGLVSEMVRLARGFFALPPEEKMLLDMSGGKKGGFTISSPFKGESVQNWREMFTFFSYPVNVRDYSMWPDKPEGWRSIVESYSEKLMELACKLLGVLSEAMGLHREALVDACVDMDQKIIVNFYPKCPQPDLALGLRQHTDPGTITILLQDEVGGLQATKDGGKTWITVKPVRGAFVVNLGDHGHYLSNGKFKSADHQAVVNYEHSRLSIATFQYPSQEAIVYPLIVSEGEKPIMDEAITFAEMYARKMSRDVELAKLKKVAKMEQHHTVVEKTEEVAIRTKSMSEIFI